MKRILATSICIIAISVLVLTQTKRINAHRNNDPISIDFYIVAHTDDWPLFMGDNAFNDIKKGHKVIFVYAVAGYTSWPDWEEAANAAVKCAVDGCAEGSTVEPSPNCLDQKLDGHSIQQCTYKNTVSYFLRLPDGKDSDGNNGGEGFDFANYESLRKLQDGKINSITSVDKVNTYSSFSELYQTIRQIIRVESESQSASSVWINAQDPNTRQNPHDNSDHTSIGCAVSNAVRGSQWNLRSYVGYDNKNQGGTLPIEVIKIKKNIALAFNDRLLLKTKINLYEGGRQNWDAWLAHTVSRGVGPTTAQTTNILSYDSSAGEGRFYSLDGECDLTLRKSYPQWRTSWTYIIPGDFAGDKLTDLLFYEQGKGEGALLINRGQGDFEQHGYSGWRKTWTQIVPGNFLNSGHMEALFYAASTGEAEIWSFNEHGEMKNLASFNGWRHSWTFIIPGDFGGDGHTDLLFYDSAAGEGDLFINDGRSPVPGGPANTYNQWRKTWTRIIPGNFKGDSHTDLLFYEAPSGDAALLTSDGRGNLAQQEFHGLRRYWTSIVAGNFLGNNHDDLLFYDASNNEIAIYPVSAQGEITPVTKLFKVLKNRAWRTTIPGNFISTE
jgi:hypothetical protein